MIYTTPQYIRHVLIAVSSLSPEPGLPESRLKFLSGLVGGAAALALPAVVLADPPLEKFVKDEVW